MARAVPINQPFGTISRSHWPRLDACINSDGLIKTDVLQLAVVVVPALAPASAFVAGLGRASAGIGRGTILAKVLDGVQFGQAMFFSRSETRTVPYSGLSPLALVVSPSNTRIIHDLTFSVSARTHSVKDDTDFDQVPPVAFGRVFPDISELCTWVDDSGRTHVLCEVREIPPKRCVWSAFDGVGCPCMCKASTSGSRLAVACRLGGRIRRGSFMVSHSSRTLSSQDMSHDDAVVMKLGSTATQHVTVILRRANDWPAPLPPGCRVPR